MIHMDPRHWKIVQDILAKYPYKFYAFGSRIKGTPKRFSDLDLCFKEEIPLSIQFSLEEDFEESDLPFKVDILEWKTLSPEFRNLIKNDLIPLERPPHAH